jgi:phage terminase small subunit
MKLTAKQAQFAVAYIRVGTATRAYREVYAPKKMSDKTVNEAASRLVKNSKVAARISELVQPAMNAANLTADRTVREVTRIAFSDARRLFREDGTLKRPDEWDDDTAAAVAGIEVTEEFEGRGKDRRLIGYTKKIKLWDKNAALDKAAKHLGLYERDNAQLMWPVSLKIVCE